MSSVEEHRDRQTPDLPEKAGPPGGEDRGGARPEPRLLEILVCPVTKTPLEYDEARQELISRAARLAYPIRNGVPLMTVEAARTLEGAELAQKK